MKKQQKQQRNVEKMCKNSQVKLSKYAEKYNGITLISLVITIIVLIILAGISINLVLGENGLFNRARKAAEEYQQAAIDEQKMTNDLEEGIEKIGNDNRPKTIVEAKDTKYSYFYEKTTLEDSDGNKVVVPAGFKIAEDSGNNVTEGIVIEDKDIIEGIGENRGNQYVWIPVSNINEDGSNLIKKSIEEGKTEGIQITLGRYTFDGNGQEALEQRAENYADETKIDPYFKELATYNEGVAQSDMTGENRTAKDLAEFISSVKENGGYYIARYEASYGKDGKPNSKISTSYSNSSAPTQEGTLWNYITQIKAAEACDNMYDTVSSDLINSYAWDTAILYIQKFSGDTDYSRQNSKNTTALANTGEREDSTTDKVCNIYDMASNCREWTTEYSTSTDSCYAYPCVRRGGSYYYCDTIYWTGNRGDYSATSSGNYCTFRPTLYISSPVS